MTHTDFVTLCKELRALGATEVHAGALRATFSANNPALPATPRPQRVVNANMTEEERRKALEAQRERELSRV